MNKIKENRIFAFALIILVYALAGITGILVYRAFNASWGLSLLVADTMATVVTFVFSLAFKNASVYDPYWSVQPPFILAAFAIKCGVNALGILMLAVVSFWAVRLTLNWACTFKSLLHQDWRYTMLNEKTGKLYPIINFIGIHMVPTLVVYGCVLPGVYVIINKPQINVFSVLCLCLSLCAAVMQGVADLQMHKYRRNRTTPFIRVGLWKYSRHPNYLGEILMWWGVGLCLLFAEPSAWYFILGAVMNTLLFLLVSIPLAEGKQSKKQGYDQYKKETRALLPIKK